jgi:tetratricopeptide (TPR) repeat protein
MLHIHASLWLTLAGLCLAAPKPLSHTATMPQQTPSNALQGATARALVAPSNEVIDALLLGDTKGALSALAELETTAPEHRDAWAVYGAEALERSGNLEGARDSLKDFEARFPDSPWRAKVRFQLAELSRALGEHGDAEGVLRAEAAALRSDERRIELGQELVAAAEALEGKAMKAPTDQARDTLRTNARLLLGEAYKLGASKGFRRDVAQRLTHLFIGQSDRGEAARWAKAVAEGAAELEVGGSTLGLEARLVAARMSLGNGGSQLHLDVERELTAALEENRGEASILKELRGFSLAFLGDAWSIEGQALYAIDAWGKLLDEQPAHPESGRVAARIARAYTNLGRNAEALEAWERARTLPSSASVSDALAFMVGLMAHIDRTDAEPRMELGVLRRRALFERALLQEAMGRYGDAIDSHMSYVADHPGAEDWNGAQQGIVNAAFGRAITWLELSENASIEDLAAAEAALQGFATEYPLDRRSSEALYRWATLPAFYGETFTEKSATDVRAKFYRSSVERLEEIARSSEAGDPELCSRALFQAAEITQNHLEDPQGAIGLYRRVTGSESASATIRLREMQDTVLRVETPGLTRPGEPMAVQVDTRNIESILVQAVRLDLGQYFLRHGTTVGIDRLDLDLIAPDFEAKLAVEDYQPFASLQRSVNVPAGENNGEPGVFAVTVIAEGKRATTLCVRSNLDMIVKRADSQVFVLVTETEGDAPRVAEGVDITVSYMVNGKRETAELRTGADGIASIMAPEGTRFGDSTHVFATKNGHVAATHLEGSSRGRAVALTPRGHVQLDRSAYRPGEEVSFRAVLRDVRDGEWKIPSLGERELKAGQRAHVELMGPGGAVLSRIEYGEISEYGTLDGSLELDPAAASGQWTLVVGGPSGVRAQTVLTVGEIEVPRVALDLSVEESVIMRGETVTVSAEAATAWGAPLPGAPIVWTDPRGTQIASTTDDDGHAVFVYETDQAALGAPLHFRAQLPEDGGIAASAAVQVAASALALNVRLERDVVLAGETFLAAVSATAPDGKTLPTEVRVIATRTFSPRPGRFAEERVFDEVITTDTAGTASVPISSASGGSLTIRASANDRFDREVTAQCSATVSDEGDAEALRVLSESGSIVAGQTAEVRVVDRSSEGGLALMTIEGSTVLEHRVLHLEPGVTELSFVAAGRHVPDVLVSISAIRGRQFHERAATFRVTRPLELAIEAPEESQPGDTAEIVIRATDGLGQPVQAEISVALVDQALLRAFPSSTGRLADHFAIQGSRTPAFVAGASSTFRYDAETEDIDAAILAEGERAAAQSDLDFMRDGVTGALGSAMFDDAPEEVEMAREAAPSPKAMAAAPRAAQAPSGAGRMGSRKKMRGPAAPSAPEVGFDDPTAYWNARLMTDARGVARLSIPMPLLEATWQLDVAGVTLDHRFGSTSSKMVTASDVVAVLHAPAYLNEGDEPQLRGEIILQRPRTSDVPVEFELRVGGLSTTSDSGQRNAEPTESLQRGSAVLTAGSTRLAYTFKKLPPIAAGGGLEFEFKASLQGPKPETATYSLGSAVRPEGYPVSDAAAGRTQSEERIELSLGGVEIVDLTLMVGATEAQWLVDAALDGASYDMPRRPGSHSRRAATPLDRGIRQGALSLASQLLGIAKLQEHGAASGGLQTEVARALSERRGSLIAALISRVGEDGGWNRGAGCWRSRHRQPSDVETTGLVIVALESAKSVGGVVPHGLLDDALRLAESMLEEADGDRERAQLCWALESAGRGNDLVLNRLHRERERLDANDLAPLALALAAAGRRPMAAEVVALLGNERRTLPTTVSRLASMALTVLARAEAGTDATAARDELRLQRPWWEPVGCGLAVAASAAAGALQSTSDAPVTLEVTVEGGSPETVQLRPKEAFGGTRELSLRLPTDGATSAAITLRLISGPFLDYAILAEGYATTPPEPKEGFPYRLGAPELGGPLPRWRGRPLGEGFSAVEMAPSERWENQLDGLAFGGEGRIALDFHVPSMKSSEMRHDFFLELPLPAGVTATVAKAGGHGFSSAEIVDGALLASLPRTAGSARVVLDVVGTKPGTWIVRAPMLRSALNPALTVYGKSRQLTVYAPDAAPEPSLRPTPDERLSRGRLAFEDHDMAATIDALGPLFEQWKRSLRPRALAETARLLLFATLKEEAAGRGTTDERSIVDWFEILKEREPSLFVSFDDTLRIAAAYTSIGEPLRANLLYKAIIDETLGEDLRVAAALDEAGEWMRASQMAAQIWRRYPDSPAADDADLALAGRLIERGMDASGAHRLNPKERSALTLRGIARLRRKVALADERGSVTADAGLALVATYARLEQWTRAAERAELLGRVIEDPIFRDSFRYSEAVARWSDTGGENPVAEEERAVEILREITAKPLDVGQGQSQWSPNRDLAFYILAQVFHARKDTDEAVEHYARIKNSFADARAALEELRSERLTLDEEVVRVRPGEVAKIGFDHKGLDGVDVLVYPVDLMTLAIRERDLSRVTAVDLAGVTPTLSESVALERSTLRPAQGEIEVGLTAPGAYLAMLRGGDVHRSALLLATDLDLDVVLAGDGSVRAQAMLASTDTFAEGASVRIIGQSIESQKTDRRGIATADGMWGKVTVIARATIQSEGETAPEQHYAFFGSSDPVQPEAAAEPAVQGEKNTNYLSNVLQQNFSNSAMRQQRVEDDVRRTRKGVQVQQAK